MRRYQGIEFTKDICCLCYRAEGKSPDDPDGMMDWKTDWVEFYIDDEGNKNDICLECKEHEDQMLCQK